MSSSVIPASSVDCSTESSFSVIIYLGREDDVVGALDDGLVVGAFAVDFAGE